MKYGLKPRAWALATLAIAVGATLAMLGPISAAIGSEPPPLTYNSAVLEDDGAVSLLFSNFLVCEENEHKTVTVKIRLVQTIEGVVTSDATATVTIGCDGGFVDVTVSALAGQKAFTAGDARLYIDDQSQMITIVKPPPKK